MLRISVLSLDGVAPTVPQVAEFGPEGGSIGREADNTLALEDPGKHLSRVQARIKWLGGEYFLVDQGGNPSRVNTRELGKGKVVSLHDGDLICMAGWELLVDFPQASRPAEQHLAAKVMAQAPAQSGGMNPLQEFDFQLATRLTGVPFDARELLEAFMRGLGLQTACLPADIDALQAEQLGAQLRNLLGSTPGLPPDSLQTLLGAALQRPAEGAPPSVPGEYPC